MPRWTLDKELEDTSEATASGYSLGKRSAKSAGKEGMKSDAPPNPTAGDEVTTSQGLYKRGGYVSARASGKRMYAKGGMVRGKCSG